MIIAAPRLPFVLLCIAGVAAAPLAACARPAATGDAVASTNASAATTDESLPLRDGSGGDVRLGDLASRATLTVLVFFDADCPVQKAHDARLRALAATYGPQGVAFVGVVSDVEADMPAVRAAATARSLPPVLQDPDAKLAAALGVEFSTHAVVLDRRSRVLYSGGIDSDRSRLTEGRQRWLEDAIRASLSGKPVAKPETKTLGCPLRLN